jgi:hypothetical protein
VAAEMQLAGSLADLARAPPALDEAATASVAALTTMRPVAAAPNARRWSLERGGGGTLRTVEAPTSCRVARKSCLSAAAKR